MLEAAAECDNAAPFMSPAGASRVADSLACHHSRRGQRRGFTTDRSAAAASYPRAGSFDCNVSPTTWLASVTGLIA
jgi:hypothetical protein